MTPTAGSGTEPPLGATADMSGTGWAGPQVPPCPVGPAAVTCPAATAARAGPLSPAAAPVAATAIAATDRATPHFLLFCIPSLP